MLEEEESRVRGIGSVDWEMDIVIANRAVRGVRAGFIEKLKIGAMIGGYEGKNLCKSVSGSRDQNTRLRGTW